MTSKTVQDMINAGRDRASWATIAKWAGARAVVTPDMRAIAERLTRERYR